MRRREEKKRVRNANDREGLRERLWRTLDIPPDLPMGGSVVEIRGQNALCVRGSGRILCYTETEVCVALYRCVLVIRGRRLVCTAYHRGALSVDGCIESVSFRREEGEERA